MLEGQGAETQMLAAVNHLSASFVLRVQRQNLSSVGLFASPFPAHCESFSTSHVSPVGKFLEAGLLEARFSLIINCLLRFGRVVMRKKKRK